MRRMCWTLAIVAILAFACSEAKSPTAPPDPPTPAPLMSSPVDGWMAASATGQAKVDVCHYDKDTGEYHLIRIAEPAVPAHIAHGDGFPGTGQFDEECNIGGGTFRIEALIDGMSQLSLQGSTAQWHHFDWAAPGRFEGAFEPTVINGVEWYPIWPDLNSSENRFCDCDSDVFAGVSPPLPPATELTIDLREIAVRDAVSVVQQPSAANGFTLVIQFDDNPSGGADWYVIEFDI